MNVYSSLLYHLKDKEGTVSVLEGRHDFEDGDLVTFTDVEGMTELNGCEPRKVHVLGPYAFTIGDTSRYASLLF